VRPAGANAIWPTIGLVSDVRPPIGPVANTAASASAAERGGG
jgi:hypothetical protein